MRRADHGIELFEEGNYAQAESELRAAVAELSQDAEALGHLALCQAELNILESAEASARRAVAIDPESSWLHVVLAEVLTRKGDDGSALKSAWRALELNRFQPTNFAAVAFLLTNLGRYQEALENAEAGLELDPECSDSKEEKGRALLGLGRVLEAADYLPARSDAQEWLGWAYLRYGHRAEALAFFENSSDRAGWLHALKLNFPFYTLWLRYNCWLDWAPAWKRRASVLATIAALCGLWWLGYRSLVVSGLLVYGYFVHCLQGLSNAFLVFSPNRRWLDREQRLEAALVAGVLFVIGAALLMDRLDLAIRWSLASMLIGMFFVAEGPRRVWVVLILCALICIQLTK
ncbi:tetratricopeptide repeat protein [bacterium]|nr:tetratricopeptide repeat protein [bacterium]